jgi:hypothetical protein
MTRRILSCLLLMLAFQFTWSAISAYCMHESGVAAQHLGHHQHKPESGDQPAYEKLAAADDGKQPSTKKTAHSHCSSCVHAVLAPAVGSDVKFNSIIQIPPERPQWRSAV